MTVVVVNGQPRDLERPQVDAVLRSLGLEPDRTGIAVALNGTVLPRAAWPATSLRDGDHVEVLTAVQGG